MNTIKVEIVPIDKNRYIRIASNGRQTMYGYYKNGNEARASFNKYSMIEYLKGCRVPKKVLTILQNK